MGMQGMTRIACGIILFLAGVTGALASPWAEVGDNQLRADIELLAMAGVIDGVTTQWPLPWTSITRDLRDDSRLMGQPAAVQTAASRVLARADWENKKGLSQSATIDLTNDPSVVHGFDSLGRGDGQGAFSFSYNSDDFAGRLSVGAFTQTFRGHGTSFMPDESYAATKLGDEALLYAGWIDHWWGPGWISALSLSNNARPMPQIGIERLDTTESSWPVLNLLGPWQAEFFVGLLDGPRLQQNTLYNALRVTFNPAPGLEIGLARTEELCGQGHPCDPLREYFDLQNDPNHLNQTNDEGDIDIKYSHDLGGMPAQFYMQLMNEDSSPIVHSGTSHLFGATIFPDIGHENPFRLTLEYSNSISTTDIFSFGNYNYGFSYTSFQYPDGMRYRGRTIGFSLDDDSQLLSLQGSWRDDDGYFYELSLHHAVIGNHHLPQNNIVSPVPVIVNMAEAHVKVPWRHITLDLAGRLQDDQPRPARGFAASIEAALRLYL
jgi:hypothetical protein